MAQPVDRDAPAAHAPPECGEFATVRYEPPSGESPTHTFAGATTAEKLPGDADHAITSVGHYRIVREIARGGMGVIYEAQDLELKRTVAIKMILSGQLASREQVARFRFEAEAAAQLDHPHIVPLFETGEHEGRPYLAMGYLAGGSLDRKLEAGPLRPREAAEILQPIADAVAYAHRHGIMHRDIKPRNILFDDNGQPRITDFGLAKPLHGECDLTTTGQIVGTPAYMSPEQAQGRVEEVGALSDVYSLGATLYRVVTGRPPFQAASAIEMVRQVIDLEPTPPRQLNSAIPRDLETICLKCLQKEPRRRYASAGELAEELERFLDGQPIRARSISLPARAVRWCQRKPAVAGLIFASLAALVSVLSAAGYRGQMQRTEAARRTAQELADARAKIAETAKDLAEAHRQTAAAQEYYSLVSSTREHIANPRPGWTWQALDDLRRAAGLDTPVKNLVGLRTLTASASTSVDFRSAGSVGIGFYPFSIAFSPDGRRLAVAEWKKVPAVSIFVYDVANRELTATYSVSTWDNFARMFTDQSSFQEGFRSVAFSPDGRWLAAGTRVGRLYLWDTTQDNSQPLHGWTVSPEQREIKRLAFSETGDALYTACGRTTFDPANGWAAPELFAEPIAPFGTRADGAYCDFACMAVNGALPPGAQDPIAVSQDGQRLAARTDRRTLAVFDRQSHAIQWELQDARLVGDKLGPQLKFSPDGSLLFSQDRDEAVRVWDLASGTLLFRVAHDGETSPPLAISPAGTHFALAGPNETRIYELRTRTAAAAVAFQNSPVYAASLTDAGDAIVSASDAMGPGGSRASSASVWDVATGQLRTESNVSVRNHPKGTPILMPHDAELSFDNAVWIGPAEAVVAGIALPPRRISNSAAPDAVFPALASVPVRTFQEDAFLCEGDAHPADDILAVDGKAVKIAGNGAIHVPLRDRIPTNKIGKWLLFASVCCRGEPGAAPTVRAGVQAGENSAVGVWEVAWTPQERYHWLFVDDVSTDWIKNQDSPELVIELQAPDGELWVDCIVATPLPEPGNGADSHYPVCSLSRVKEHNLVVGVVARQAIVAWSTPGMEIAWERHNTFATTIAGANHLTCASAGAAWTVAGTELGDLLLVETGTGRFETIHSGAQERVAIRSLCAIPGGSLFALGDANGALKVVQLPEGKTVFRTEAHTRSVDSLAISADGRMLVSGGRDCVVKVWDCEKEGLRLAYSLPTFSGPIRKVDLDDEGDTLAVVAAGERAVRVWRLDRLAREFEAQGVP